MPDLVASNAWSVTVGSAESESDDEQGLTGFDYVVAGEGHKASESVASPSPVFDLRADDNDMEGDDMDLSRDLPHGVVRNIAFTSDVTGDEHAKSPNVICNESTSSPNAPTQRPSLQSTIQCSRTPELLNVWLLTGWMMTLRVLLLKVK